MFGAASGTAQHVNTVEPDAEPSSEPSARSRSSPQTESALERVKQRFSRLMQRKGMRHIVRALDRFNDRAGNQFAAAITYFSFLAVVPILMVAFSIAGFVLSSRPELVTGLRNDVAEQLPGGLSSVVDQVLDTAVNGRFTVGVIGLVIALYSGVSWMGNVRSAVQAQWRPDYDEDQETRDESLGRYYWRSLKYLVFFGLAILGSLTLSAAGSWAQGIFLRWVGLDEAAWVAPFVAVTPLLLAVLADIGIFYLLYDQLSPKKTKAPRKALLRGAIVAAIAFEVLKVALGLLLKLLLVSATAKLFGPIIGLLFFFNLVATVVLFVAAWIATADEYVPTRPLNKLDR